MPVLSVCRLGTYENTKCISLYSGTMETGHAPQRTDLIFPPSLLVFFCKYDALPFLGDGSLQDIRLCVFCTCCWHHPKLKGEMCHACMKFVRNANHAVESLEHVIHAGLTPSSMFNSGLFFFNSVSRQTGNMGEERGMMCSKSPQLDSN